MLNRLSSRIALAFVAIAFVTVLAVGAALFVALRSLHEESATAALAETSQPLVFQARAAAAGGDLRTLLANLRAQVEAEGISVQLVRANGSILDLGGDAAPAEAIPIDPAATRGTVLTGSVRFADGRDHVYAVTVLRSPNGTGPRAIILSRLDTSGGDALRDLARTLPFVILLVVLAGAPVAYLLTRSVTGPLRRLARATADLPVAAADPLPLEGPLEVRELTGRFNAMAAELATTWDREDRLLANLRHDLRTPLTVISGYATALADGTATGDDAARAAQVIGEEAARLERLVAELDALERLHDSPLSLRPEPLEAREVVRDTVSRFEATAAVRGVELVGSAPTAEDSTITFAADRLAVERILGNLVENAISAVASSVGEGGITGHVWMSARQVASIGDRDVPGVAFSVTDDGPGFPPGDVMRAFERFYRADPSRSGGGAGLGLAIVRELARAHGGEAIAENVSPHGARLSVLLPLTPAPGGTDPDPMR